MNPGNAATTEDLLKRARELVVIGDNLGWSREETAGTIGMSIDRMDDDSAELVWSTIEASANGDIADEIGIGLDHPLRAYAVGVADALKLMAADDGEEPEAAGEGSE